MFFLTQIFYSANHVGLIQTISGGDGSTLKTRLIILLCVLLLHNRDIVDLNA